MKSVPSDKPWPSMTEGFTGPRYTQRLEPSTAMCQTS